MTKQEFIDQFFPKKHTQESFTGAHIYMFACSAVLYDMEINQIEYPHHLKELAKTKMIMALEQAKNLVAEKLQEIQDAVIIDLVTDGEIN